MRKIVIYTSFCVLAIVGLVIVFSLMLKKSDTINESQAIEIAKTRFQEYLRIPPK
jgi:hypothetical protein